MNDIFGMPPHFHSTSNVCRASRDEQCLFAIQILERYSLRVSEVLRLSYDCLFPPDTVFIKISKSNHYFEVIDKSFFDTLSKFFDSLPEKKFQITYYNLYKFILKHRQDIILRSVGKTRKVTHTFRYKRAVKLKSLPDNEKKIQASLHHKSIKSQKYYKR